MSDHLEGPAALSSYRVPRSPVDDNFSGDAPSPVLIGSGRVMSVEVDTCSVMVNDEELAGVLIMGDDPDVGDIVEVWSIEDLLFTPADDFDYDSYVEGMETDAEHIVSAEEPAQLKDANVNIAGAMRDESSWYFTPSESPGWVRNLTQAGTGFEITRADASGVTPSETGTLWSEAEFEVRSGDTLTVNVTASFLNPEIATMQAVICWGPEDSEPVPGTDAQIIPYGSPVAVDGEGRTFTVVITVPDLVSPTSGDVVPGAGRIGIAFNAALGGGGGGGSTPETVTDLTQTTTTGGAITYDPTVLHGTGFLQDFDPATAQTILGDGDDATGVAASVFYDVGGTNVIQDYSLQGYNAINPVEPVSAATGVTLHVRYLMDSPDGGSLDGRDGVLMVYQPDTGSYDFLHLPESTSAADLDIALSDDLAMRAINQGLTISLWPQDTPPEPYVSPGWRTVKILELTYHGTFTIQIPIETTYTSRPGNSTPIDQSDPDPANWTWDLTAPADWPAGDNNVATSMSTGIGAAYGTVFVYEGANGPNPVVPNDGSEYADADATWIRQTAHVIYSSDSPVTFTVDQGDGAQLTFEEGAPGEQVELVSTGGGILTWAGLFASPADITIHEWWIETVTIGGGGGGSDTVDLLLTEADLSRHEVTGWPIGSIWFDPDAETGGLTTASAADQDTDTVTTLPAGSDWDRAPGFQKVTVTCPMGTGGILEVLAQGLLTIHGSPVVELRLATDSDDGLFPLVRLPLTQAFTLAGNLRLDPGDSAEVFVEYRYVSGSGATVEATSLLPTFYPAGVRPGVTADAWGRYWDGDSWRPAYLHGAQMDFEDGVEPPVVKDDTTTTVTRTPASINPNQMVTLNASVSPGGADGNVMFFKGATATGPWTKLGAVPLGSGNHAKKTVTLGQPQEVFFRARYQGNRFYTASDDTTNSTIVNGPRRTVHTKIAADWVESYQGDGDANDNVVRQGYFDDTDGNEKSMIGFTVPLPGDADVQSVRLVCKNWSRWSYGESGGTLRVGWHSHTAEPDNFGVGMGETDKSAHRVNHQGAFDVALPVWAANALQGGTFRGITLGGGDTSRSREYNGHADNGAGPWVLDVIYTTRT